MRGLLLGTAILIFSLTSADAAETYNKGKFCSPFNETGNRIALPVPDSWNITDCIRFAQIARWQYVSIGCMGPHQLELWNPIMEGKSAEVALKEGKLAGDAAFKDAKKCGW
jgi:hypothetical protein